MGGRRWELGGTEEAGGNETLVVRVNLSLAKKKANETFPDSSFAISARPIKKYVRHTYRFNGPSPSRNTANMCSTLKRAEETPHGLFITEIAN